MTSPAHPDPRTSGLQDFRTSGLHDFKTSGLHDFTTSRRQDLRTSAKLVTFEGIEGAGKSAHLRRLEAEFRRRGLPCLVTCEPGGTQFGRELRTVLLHRDGAPREPLAELLLYLADRHQHLKEVIEPALREGRHVLCDRYHDSTVAYQGYARGLSLKSIEELADILEIRRPDLTLVFDVDVRIGLERAKARNLKDRQDLLSRFENEPLEFHEKVREGFHFLARQDPDRMIIIDSTPEAETVFPRVLAALTERAIL